MTTTSNYKSVCNDYKKIKRYIKMEIYMKVNLNIIKKVEKVK